MNAQYDFLLLPFITYFFFLKTDIPNPAKILEATKARTELDPVFGNSFDGVVVCFLYNFFLTTLLFGSTLSFFASRL